MSTILAQKAFPRLSTSLTVVLSDGKAQYVARTKNLSDMGLCLHPMEVLPVGTRLHLVFGQPPDLPRLSMEGVVRWSDGGKGVGVQFTFINPHDYRALLKFLNSPSRAQQV
jgi:hypothetical protein